MEPIKQIVPATVRLKLVECSSDVQPPLRNLDTWLSIAWTGDGVQVGRDNEDARYVVASDGGEGADARADAEAPSSAGTPAHGLLAGSVPPSDLEQGPTTADNRIRTPVSRR